MRFRFEVVTPKGLTVRAARVDPELDPPYWEVKCEDPDKLTFTTRLDDVPATSLFLSLLAVLQGRKIPWRTRNYVLQFFKGCPRSCSPLAQSRVDTR